MAYTQIDIQNVNLHAAQGYGELTVKYCLSIPARYSSKAYVANIAASLGYLYETADDNTTKVFSKVVTQSLDLAATPANVRTSLVQALAQMQTDLNNSDLSPLNKLNGLSYDGTAWAN